jgi:hypothetical protein
VGPRAGLERCGISRPHRDSIPGQLVIFKDAKYPHGLRRGSVVARLLGLRVLIPPGAWMSLASVVYCQVEVSASS